jgi:hypothetical protein
MANRENRLVTELRTNAERLGVDAPDTTGMNDQQLQEAIDGLKKLEEERAKIEQGRAESEQDKAMQGDIREQNTDGVLHHDTAGGESTRQLAPYTVAEGRSITAGGEMRDAGAAVQASDFPGGQEHLDKLVEAKLVTKNS